MQGKKKVGLLIPSLHSGGAERVMSIISHILADNGYEVFLLLFDTTDICYSYKGTLIDFRSIAGKNLLTRAIKRISRILKLSYYNYKLDLDVVLSFLHPANSVNYYAFGRVKKILSCRGYHDYINYSRRYAKMMRRISAFVVQTEKMKSDFIEQYNVDSAKVRVLYNPINLELIEEQSRESIESNVEEFIRNHRTICTAGTFKKEKGYWHLIKAFSIAKESIPDAGLIFIGNKGEIEKNIIEMAETCRYKNDIIFLGYQSNPFKYVSKCDLFVCSSIYEGIPNALLEAMACGTAVVSTDCKTGPRELLTKEVGRNLIISDVSYMDYGVLVPELDSKIDFSLDSISENTYYLAEAITAMLSDQVLLAKYQALAKQRAEEFDMYKFVDQLVEVIE